MNVILQAITIALLAFLIGFMVGGKREQLRQYAPGSPWCEEQRKHIQLLDTVDSLLKQPPDTMTMALWRKDCLGEPPEGERPR